MNAKYADDAYVEKAKSLSDDETERVLSRMGEKLRKRKFKDKIDCITAVAIQLELEDEMLHEWRENLAKIRAKHDKKEALNAPEIVPEKPVEQPKVEAKPKSKASKEPVREATPKKTAVKANESTAQQTPKPKSSGAGVAKSKSKVAAKL